MYHYLLDKNWEYVESGLLNPLMVNMLSGWKKTNLPHDYAMEKERSKDVVNGLDEGFTQGAGLYYKKTFVLSEKAVGKRIYLEFEGVSGMTEVWVNGQFAAKHVNPYTSFTVEITNQVKEGENVISLHTDSRLKPNSRWYVGAGLYRPVWLHIAEQVSVKPHGVQVTTKELNGNKAVLDVEIELAQAVSGEEPAEGERAANDIISIEVEVTDDINTQVASVSTKVHTEEIGVKTEVHTGEQTGQQKISLEIPVSDITPWSPEHPALYTAKITVSKKTDADEAAAAAADVYEETFGIRTVSVNPQEGFLLNGVPMKLKGGCIHHDLGILGAADHEAAEYRRVKLLKESGFNALRLSHNPYGPAIFKVCDQLGMLVVEEAFDEWVLGRTSFGSHMFFEDCWERDLEDMIGRDYNHPSIIMWSTGNEVEERDGSADGYAWSRRLAERVKSLDASRPVSATACSLFIEYTQQRPKDEEGTTGNQALNMAYDNFASGVDLWGDATAEYYAPLDVAGYNYKTVRYEHDGKKFPNRVIYGSESYPRAAFSSWEATMRNPHVIGDFVWTAWDYIGEVGIGRWEVSEAQRPGNPAWPWLAAGCSDIDLIGEKRPQSYYRDAIWENDHAPHLFTLEPELVGKNIARLSWGWLPVAANYTFPDAEGKTIEAHIYANADEVELLQNGTSLGRKNCGYEQEYQAIFTLDYVPGTLEAVSYKDGQETGRDTLITADRTAELKLSADRYSIKADGRDLAFVTIQAVDENGHPVYIENKNLTVEVQGAELLALGTADVKPDRLIPYKGNTVPMHEGKALAVIRSTEGGKGCLLQASLEGGIKAQTGIGFAPAEAADTTYVSEPKAGALELPIGELLENEAAKEVLNQIMPGILDNPMLESIKGMSLKKMSAMSGMQFDKGLVEQLDQAMGM